MKSKEITFMKKTNKEIFDNLAEEWWKDGGKFDALHAYNPVRINFILKSFKKNLKSVEILDIGCGGGILCEPLSRLGASVTGIDENKKAIEVASSHAKKKNLKIKYFCGKISDLPAVRKFDIVTCMEVVEHVDSLESIISAVKSKLKPNGLFVGSTINQTLTSYFSAILMAEFLLQIVPKYTHSWKKFVKPNKLKKELLFQKFSNISFQGVIYNPLKKNWNLSKNLLINYMFSCNLKK